MKIYLSGAMSGYSDEEVELKFRKAEERLRRLGFTDIYNPYTNTQLVKHLHPNPTWIDFIIIDLMALKNCHAIYFLDGELSAGCEVELISAKRMELLILHENESDIVLTKRVG